MKISKYLAILLSVLILFTGCANRKTITTNNPRVTRTYEPYGLFDPQDRNPNIEYTVSMGNVLWSAILFETVIAPIILIGWYIYEPKGPKITDPNMRGVVYE